MKEDAGIEEAAEKYYKDLIQDMFGGNSYQYAIDHTIKTFKAGAEHQKSIGWVRCSERLPEVGEAVLLYQRGDILQYHFGNLTHNGKIQYYSGDFCRLDKNFTDWHPLPPPPGAT